MDDRRFDSLAAAFGAVLDRRAGLKAAVAGVAAALAGGSADAASPGKGNGNGNGNGKSRPGRPSAEGPCGSTAKANRCAKDGDCCTGLCNPKNRKCRCVSREKACTEDRNCCSRGGKSVACVDGVCARGGGGTIATGDPCQPGDGCQDKKAICTSYTNGGPAGTYCLLQTGGTCGTTDGDCISQFCNGGVCQPCTVCSSPASCRYRTIGAAVLDAAPDTVIGIAAGTYDTYLSIETDNLTLRRCGGDDAGSVMWTQEAGDGSTLDLEETGISAFTVKNIDFMGAYQYEVIIATGASDKRLTLTIEGCTFTGKYDVSPDYNYSAIATENYTNTTITDTTFTGFHSDNDGGAAFSSDGDLNDRNIVTMTNVTATGCYGTYGGGAFDLRGSTSTLTNCTISNNIARNNGGGINIDGGGTVTLIDCTVTGNATSETDTNAGIGGGVSVRENGNPPADVATLVIQGSTTITGNTATGSNASNGGGVISQDGGVITGGSLTNITNNNPSGQNCTTVTGGSYATVSCATWT